MNGEVVLKEDAFCFAMLEYAKEQKPLFDPYAAVVFKSFK